MSRAGFLIPHVCNGSCRPSGYWLFAAGGQRLAAARGLKRGVEPLLFVGSYQAEQLGSAPVPTAQTRENTIDNALVLNASNQRDRPLAATAASKSEQIH